MERCLDCGKGALGEALNTDLVLGKVEVRPEL
jgi:hypothetical protein